MDEVWCSGAAIGLEQGRWLFSRQRRGAESGSTAGAFSRAHCVFQQLQQGRSLTFPGFQR